ncbi:MAG: oxidoreductase, partial [Aeromicrobium sp.]
MNPSRPVVAGVLSAAAGLAVGEAIAAVLDVRESPLLAVGQGVIALTPGPIAEAIIGVVGTADKPLAVTSVVIAVLALGGVAGRWWDVRRVRSMILVALLVAGASVAVLVRPYSSAPGVFAAVAGGTAMIVVLQLFAVANHETANVPKGGRRGFLRMVAFVAIGIAVAGGGSQLLAARHRRRRDVERARA